MQYQRQFFILSLGFMLLLPFQNCGSSGFNTSSVLQENQSQSSDDSSADITDAPEPPVMPNPPVSDGTNIVLDGFTNLRPQTSNHFFQQFKNLTQGAMPTAAGYGDGSDTANTGPCYIDLTDGISANGSLRHDTGPGANVGGTSEGFSHIYNDMPASDSHYRAYWFKATRTQGTVVANGFQVKGVRFGRRDPNISTNGAWPYYHNIEPGFRSSLYLGSAAPGTAESSLDWWYGFNRGAIDENDRAVTDGDGGIPETNIGYKYNQWNFIEVIGYVGQAGVANGFYQIRMNGHTVFTDQNLLLRTNSSLLINSSELFPGVDFPIGTQWTFKFDDDYLSGSLARVVMTNHAVYASSTKFAVQPEVRRTATTIEFKSNLTNFSSGDTVYYHVFDHNGVAIRIVQRTLP